MSVFLDIGAKNIFYSRITNSTKLPDGQRFVFEWCLLLLLDYCLMSRPLLAKDETLRQKFLIIAIGPYNVRHWSSMEDADRSFLLRSAVRVQSSHLGLENPSCLHDFRRSFTHESNFVLNFHAILELPDP